MPRVADPTGRRRREILAVATSLFASHGYHGTAMSDIADAAHLTKGSLYHYFAAKSDLLLDVYDGVLDAMLTRAYGHAAEESPETQLRGVVQDILDVIAERPLEVRVYYRENSVLRECLPTASYERVREREAEFTRHVMSLIECGAAQGVFRPTDSKLAAFGVIGLVGWASQWFDPKGDAGVREIAAVYGDLAVDGLRARPTS